jgi:hypothetical protein
MEVKTKLTSNPDYFMNYYNTHKEYINLQRAVNKYAKELHINVEERRKMVELHGYVKYYEMLRLERFNLSNKKRSEQFKTINI